MSQKIWTIAETKSRLSEILRLAQDTPQRIGTKNRFVILPEEEWLRSRKSPELGKFLVKNLRGAPEISVPDRKQSNRPTPFEDHENK